MSASPDEKMGLLLLSGWIMLQDCCPNCNCPLLSLIDRKTIKCVVCPPPDENKPADSPEATQLSGNLSKANQYLSILIES